MTRAVANRYATALAEVVQEPDSGLTPESTLDQLEGFAAMLRESPELDSILRTPAIGPGEKRGLVGEIAQRAGWSPYVQNFLGVVIDQRRVAHFDMIVRAFRDWLDEQNGRVAVEIRTARPLDAEQRAALEERFRALIGKEVRTQVVDVPSLLGGSQVLVGSTLYDGSLRSALDSLGQAMESRDR